MIRLIRQYLALRKVNRLARKWRESHEGRKYIEHRQAAKLGWERRRGGA